MPASGSPLGERHCFAAGEAPRHEPRPQALAAVAPSAAQASDEAVLSPLAGVASRQDLGALAMRLQELRTWLADDLAELERALQAAEASQVHDAAGTLTGTGQAVAHLLALPGKRIRPLCVIVAARLGGRGMDAAVRPVAMACELVHAATLLHDDVVDDSQKRRGAKAARTLFGNAASILAGDHLLVHALRLVEGAGVPGLTASLLEVMARMVRAEAQQLERRGQFVPSREVYLDVIAGKTAALFAWGLQAGALLGGRSEAERALLGQVGMHLGSAFQLVDDVLDMEGDAALTGKNALQDLREGKLTWPLILAAERAPAIAARLARLAGAERRGAALPSRALLRLRQDVQATGAVDATRAFARLEAAKACRCLEQLPSGRARDALGWVVQSAVHRLR